MQNHNIMTIDTRVSDIDKYVGQKLKECRITQGLSQQTLGKIANVSIQQIQKYEKGTNRISSGKLFLFAQFLQVPLTYFFEQINFANINDLDHDVSLDRDAIAIIKAFTSINNPDAKSKILNLIKTIANAPNSITN